MFVGREQEMIKNAKENPKEFFRCNPNWPLCRFNFIRPHLVVEEFVFRIESSTKIDIF